MFILRGKEVYIVFVTVLFLTSGLSFLMQGEVDSFEDTLYKNVKGLHLNLDLISDYSKEYDLKSENNIRTISFNKNNHEKGIFSIEVDDLKLNVESFILCEENGIEEYKEKSNDKNALNGFPNENKIKYTSENNYEINYDVTVNGIKETLVLYSYPDNITSDLILRSKIWTNSFVKTNNNNGSYNIPEKDIKFFFNDFMEKEIFSISKPFLLSSPESIMTENGKLEMQDTIKRMPLEHRYHYDKHYIYHDIIIPKDVVYSDIKYPLYVDPSITTFSGITTYEGYVNGSISQTIDGDTTWYYDCSRTILLDSSITIGVDEVLTFKNIRVKANDNDMAINVDYGGTLNIIDNSVLTANYDYYEYTVIYKYGSYGNILDSEVKKAKFGNGIEIRSSNVWINNSLIHINGDYGVYIYQSNPIVSHSNINTNDYGVYVTAFSSPTLVGNDININTYGVYYESSNVVEEFSSSINIDQLVGTKYESNSVQWDVGLGNYALTCPSVTVDSTYQAAYNAGHLYDGITEEVWWNQWDSWYDYNPHWAVFDFQEQKTVDEFIIHHRSDFLTQDYLIQTWTGSSWSTQVNVNDNTQQIRTHTLGSSVTTQKIRLYITDANPSDGMARVREFEIYGETDDYECHYMITDPIETHGDTIFGNLILDKTEPGDSQILVSILDGVTENVITGFDRLESDEIDLKWIDTEDHPSIKIKAEFEKVDTDTPTLNGYDLYFSPLKDYLSDFESDDEFSSMNYLETRNGQATLELEEEILDEEWSTGWDSRWTVETFEDGGDVYVSTDYWEDSGNDLYMHGKSLSSTSGHNGHVQVSKNFGEIDPGDTIQTHFEGSIHRYDYNEADFEIYLYNSGMTSFKKIRWTTNNNTYDPGISGDTYYIIAQDTHPFAPYFYDVVIHSTIENLFEKYFGEEQVDFETYNVLYVKSFAIEQYNHHENPKVYIDYFIVSDIAKSGSAISTVFELEPLTKWAFVALNKDAYYNTDVKVSILNGYGESIEGYTELSDEVIDISNLNYFGIESIRVKYDLIYSEEPPAINWMKVLMSPIFDDNIIDNNEYGIVILNSLPMVSNNTISNSTYYGLHIQEDRVETRTNTGIKFIANDNYFYNNPVGVEAEMTCASFSGNEYRNNDVSIDVKDSSVWFIREFIYGNEGNIWLNDSYIYFKQCLFTEGHFDLFLLNSEVMFDNLTGTDNDQNSIDLKNSIATFLDSRYCDSLTKSLDATSEIYHNWRFSLYVNDDGYPNVKNIDVYDRNEVSVLSVQTDDNGYYEGSLPEKVIDNVGEDILSPLNVKVNTNYNNFYLNMKSPQHHSIIFGYDSDGDSIADLDEKEEGKYLFEAEDFVGLDKQNNTGAFQVISLDDSNIVPIDIDLTESDVGDYKYSIAVKAHYFDGSSDQSFQVVLSQGVSGGLDESFEVDSVSRWYQTPWFIATDDNIIGEIIDLGGGEEVEVDKFMCLKRYNDPLENPPVINSPLISDIDEDDLPDGYETTPFGCYIEAEHTTLANGDIEESIDAINSKYVENTNNNDPTLSFSLVVDETTDYYVYVRAIDISCDDPHFSVDIGGISKNSPELDEEFNWYPFTFSLTQGTKTVNIRAYDAETIIGIDRIIIIKVSDVEISTAESENIEIPIWANIRQANFDYIVGYGSSSTIYDNHMQSNLEFDIDNNLTVFSSNDNIYAYNDTNDLLYEIETGGEIDSEKPSISRGEVVYQDDSGNIYYSDIRKGPSNIDTELISYYDETNYYGNTPKISDGTVVWSYNNQLVARLTDSWHLIPIQDESNYQIKQLYDVSGRTVAWVSIYNDGINPAKDHIRMAYLGILADIQEGKVDESYLSPHIFDIAETTSQYYDFEHIDVYENRVVFMEANENTGASIMVYDHETGITNQEYPVLSHSLNIDQDQPVHIYGDYISWVETISSVNKIRVKEIGDSTIYTIDADPESYELNLGRIIYHLSGQSNIQAHYSDVNFYINENQEDICYHHDKQITVNERTSFDFSDYFNYYLDIIRDAGQTTFDLTLNTNELVGGDSSISEINILIDGVTDPFCNDLDGDYLSDGYETLEYFNSSLMEIEDTMVFKEWIEPKCGDPDPTWTNLASSMYTTSPMFYPEGIDLISGDYIYDKDEEDEYMWVNSTSFIEYNLHGVDSGNTYQINTVKNDRIWEAYADFDDFDFDNMQTYMSSRGGEFDVYGPSTDSGDLKQDHYWLNDTENQYINDVLDHIIVFNFSGVSDEPVNVKEEYRDYHYIWSAIGRISDSAEDYYDEEEEADLLLLALDMEYSAEVIFGGSTGYKMEIRIDLDLLPDELNPLMKDQLEEDSLVPDGFPAKRFHFIKLMNLDRIVLQEKSISSIYRDTDGDELTDPEEIAYNSYPLSNDPDLDGISDKNEIKTYSTNAGKRDTDGDGIRDPVEISIEDNNLLTEESIGSYYERKARYGDFFIFNPITNVDADIEDLTPINTNPLEPDTDFDGLPDGWIDGWRYFGEFETGYAGSYYSPEHWEGGFDYDNLIQVFEGEDLNLDGGVDSIWSSWNFDGLTFEFKGQGSSECNPLEPDSDSDDMPDGYEIWYSTQEPFVQDNGNLILNPLVDDASLDLDSKGYDILFKPANMLSGTHQVNSGYFPIIAQEIDITPSSDMKKISGIGVVVSLGEVKSIDIWTGDGNGPINKIHTARNSIDVNDFEGATEYVFKVPQGIFYNGLSGGIFYVAIPYAGENINWKKSDFSGNAYRYSISTESWTTADNLMFILYEYDLVNDGLSNLQEYIVGTNPKNRSSDIDKWETWNDKLEDGEEVATYGEGLNYVLARTDIENGALTFDDVESGTSSGEYYNYNRDPLGNSVRFEHFVFEDNLNDKGDQYIFTAWESRVPFSLRDGSLVTYTQEGANTYLIVWDDNYIDFNTYWEDQLGNKYINCSYVRFTFDELLTSGQYIIDIDFRGQDIYFSDPCRFDTDNDGILDGEEIDWNQNSDDSFSLQEETDLGTDYICNVRDIDSDNDGVDDGEEINFDQVCQGQGLDVSDTRKNMIDPDSDGDGLYDGIEHDWASDTDHDGICNMEDPDSDNDGLCDGWKPDYVWDPKANSNEGGFVDESESDTFSASDFDVDDVWEGEDQDCDGIVDSTETNPLHWDSDTDGLWDGFDVKVDGEMKLGEIYIPDSTILDGFVQGYTYKRLFSTIQQSSSTDPLNEDTDGDGLVDGNYELFGWGSSKYIFIRLPTANGCIFSQYTDIKSDPSEDDTDSDGLLDGEEYSNHSLPYEADSDQDGITDNNEITLGTFANNCDSDNDGLPDGYVDGWWYDIENDKWYLNSSRIDTNCDFWEGENHDCDSLWEQSNDETNPLSDDSDDDTLLDPYEYFFYIHDIDGDMDSYDYDDWYDPSDGSGSYQCNADGNGRINPLDSDSDDDGLLDGEENYDGDNSIDASVIGTPLDHPDYTMARETNPFMSDSDGDGVVDGLDSKPDPDEETDPVFWRWDTDGDGLINAMDRNSDGTGNIDSTDSTPLGDLSLDPESDEDSDGLTEEEELLLGSDPDDADTDDDGLDDGDEVNTYGSDPTITESDGDTLNDGAEVTRGSDPSKMDTDADGRPDNEESNEDLDNDGLLNFEDDDDDGDGLLTWSEDLTYHTNPYNSDGDYDLLNDGSEILYYLSDPNSQDTDNDDWPDGFEIFKSKTCHLNPDSDYDGVIDSIDFEPNMGQIELLFTIREFIPLGSKSDEAEKSDPFLVARTYYSYLEEPEENDWKDDLEVKWDWWIYEQSNQGKGIWMGEDIYNNPKSVFNWIEDDEGGNPYEYINEIKDYDEEWKDDGVKTRNEMTDRFSFATSGLDNSAILVKFIIFMYDSDSTSSKPDIFDISPKINTNDVDLEIPFLNDNSINSNTNGQYLEIIYNLHTSSWTYKTSGDVLKEGFYIERNQYDSSDVINYIDENDYYSKTWKDIDIIYEEGGIGLCNGINDNDYNNRNDALISFDIFPFDYENYRDEGENDFISGDMDHDKLTSISEILWYGTDCNNKNTDSIEIIEYDDGYVEEYKDGFSDRFDILTGSDPIKNQKGENTLNYTSYSYYYRNNDYDKINEYVESKYYNYGFSPYYTDFAFELDWFPNNNVKEKNINKLIILFAKHNMLLHIDDSNMGGGGEVERGKNKGGYFEIEAANTFPGFYNDFYDYYGQDSDDVNGKFFHRNYYKGGFSYGLLCDNIKDNDGRYVGGVATQLDDKFLVNGKLDEEEVLWLILHEIGHNFGLGGISYSENYLENNHGDYCSDDFLSAMNYKYPLLLDYHNGDFDLFNDWQYLQSTWSKEREYL